MSGLRAILLTAFRSSTPCFLTTLSLHALSDALTEGKPYDPQAEEWDPEVKKAIEAEGGLL